MNLDTALFIAGLAAEAAIVILLLSKRVYRLFPFFCSYVFWSLLSDITQYALTRRFPNSDLRIYFAGTIIDSVLQFGVLVELSVSVLRPVRSALHPRIVVAIACVIALVCAGVWPFAKTPGLDSLLLVSRLIVHFQITFAVMRILFFLALAACSQLLSIGWRDRELQIATGLGFFSIVSLSVALLHTNHGPVDSAQYHLLEQLLSASYICSIGYWIVSFAQKVPERREFTPQMQSFLVALAGNARATRVALTTSGDSKPGKPVGR